MTSEKVEDIFSRLLTAMWLRPERALYEAHILSKVSKLITPYLESNSLEFGCLDGVPTFCMVGGVFSDEFDDYFGINRVSNESVSNEKITAHPLQFRPDDFFEDFLETPVLPIVRAAPKHKFDLGVSFKDSHIQRAQRLGTYTQLWKQSLSDSLPVDDSSLGLVYAPMLFWLDVNELRSTIKELSRCTEKGGRLVTAFPKEGYERNLLLGKFANFPSEWRREIDGGSSKKLTGINLGVAELEKLFWECGYASETIEEAVPIRVAQVYEIGFRAMFPVFLTMRESLARLKDNSLLEIKTNWIATVKDFLTPLCHVDMLDPTGAAATWNVLKLRKV